MSIKDFQRSYLTQKTGHKDYFYDKLWPRMKNEFRNLMLQVKKNIDPHRRHHGFEILGFDFMLDDQLNL